MRPVVTFNCPEKWENMKIGLHSLHCENCARDVHDFTRMSREDILHYLWTNRSHKVCGRIMKSQLDYHRNEILVTIESYLAKNKNSNLSFYLLAAASWLVLSCGPSQKELAPKSALANENIMAPLEQQKVFLSQTLSAPFKCDTVELTGESRAEDQVDTMEPTDFVLLGDINITDPVDALKEHSIIRFADVMPEFVGGYSGLMDYLKERLQYPEWEKKNGIEGTIFVSFVVEKTGEIRDPKVVRSVTGSRNFDAEVLRVLQQMPRWKPGLVSNVPVDVEFTLPIRFKI